MKLTTWPERGEPAVPSQRLLAVTGASGFIGHHLCDHFRRLGWEVRALVRDPARFPGTDADVRCFRCNLPDLVEDGALDGVEVLIHCAYMMRFANRAEAERTNVLGTQRLLDRARAARVRRFVFLSSQAAHEEARSYYGKSKYNLERQVLAAGQLVVRPGFVLGAAGEGLFQRIRGMLGKAKVVPLFGGGHQPCQTIHIDDLCLGIERAIARDLTGLFCLAEPRPVEMGEFFRMTASRLGRRPLFVPLPLLPALVFLRGVERLRIPFPVSSENLLGLAGARAMETGRDLEMLGLKVRSVTESLDDIFSGPAAGESERLPSNMAHS